jgi:hypothetical protein
MQTLAYSNPVRSSWGNALVPAVLAAACFFGVASSFAQPAHLVNGNDLVDDIVTAQAQGVFTGDVNGATVFLNRYGGSWDTAGDLSFIRFFDANRNPGPYAANYTTCAPLVTHLLKFTYGWDWKQHPIPDSLDNGSLVAKASPKSYLYVSAIKNQIGFSAQITNVLSVQPGDIGARWEVGTDEGHTMIVVGVNTANPKAYPLSSSDVNFVPELAGTTYYELTVLDSSASGHSNDTRMITYNGKTELSGGAGRGVMGVFVNASGNLVAHTWSLPTSNYLSYDKVSKSYVVSSGWLSGIKSRLKKQTDVELVFGRLPAMATVTP